MNEVIERCRLLAELLEEPGFTTRTFLSPPMHAVHAHLRTWMEQAGMTVAIDHAGNMQGSLSSAIARMRRACSSVRISIPFLARARSMESWASCSAVALIERLAGRRLPFAIEVIGFSEEEGVRFGVPFIGSRALIGDIDRRLLLTRSRRLRDHARSD